jgi:inner membrane protein
MDNITHTLTAIALSRAGLNRLCPRATLLLLISANIPDLDMVTLFRGTLTNLEIHRGYTHSLLLFPVMAALATALSALLCRQKLPWLRAWLIACVGVLSHLLLDLTNAYGIRLGLPFSSKWFYLDLNYLFDGVIMSVLIIAALWPLLARLVSDEIGERRKTGPGLAIFALVFFASYDGARFVLHQRAIAQLESRLYEGEEPLRVAALPRAVNPLVWDGIVETSSAYHVYAVPGIGEFDPAGGDPLFKSEWRPSFEAAAKTEPFRYLMYYARFPLWRESPAAGGSTPLEQVELIELRFGHPPNPTLHAEALVNNQNQVIETGITFLGPMRKAAK